MEEKKIFDPEFVHFMWDDSLEGKEGFFSDSIDTLITRVNSNIRETIDAKYTFSSCAKGGNEYPFSLKGSYYRFFYYDPLYEIKWAWKQGKQIQARSKGSTRNEWANMEHPGWLDGLDCLEYRVRPEKEWRPFKDIQELKDTWGIKLTGRADIAPDYGLTEPMIWVRSKSNTTSTYLITHYCENMGVVYLCGYLNVSLEQLFDDYIFLDGTTLGVEE